MKISSIGCLATALMVLSLATDSMATPTECDRFCHPGQSCWPSQSDEIDFYLEVNGHLKTAFDKDYSNVTIMINTWTTKLPYFIVMATTVDEVISAVKFANKYNIRITVRSSGHDYIGRSTADGSLQINLSKMDGIKFNLSSSRNADGEVTVESGNTWLRVYNETNKVGRVIVGGSAHTVSMGGYTLGGGHSPISRKFGLAIDNLLEVDMILANASRVIANEQGTTVIDPDSGSSYFTPNNDLFWAVRGGGGSTFGIVISFTFKLHKDSPMVVLTCMSPVYDEHGKDVGRAYLESFYNLLSTSLAPEWGGYTLISNAGTNTTKGSILFFLNHFGAWGSPSFNTMRPFLHHCSAKNVSSFLEYEITTYDPLYYRQYIFGTFIQPDGMTPQTYDDLYSMFNDPRVTTGFGCNGILIGGNMKQMAADSTAMNPNIRTGMLSFTCGLSWSSPVEDEHWTKLGEEFTPKLLQHGQGVYFNEPSAYLPNWKTEYWGGHYDKLLAIKHQWDPLNIFTCYHCVGSDEAPIASATSGHTAQTQHKPDIPHPIIFG